METITEYLTLRNRIDAIDRPSIVAIEGFSRSGKSLLANQLATDLNATVLHTDDVVRSGDKTATYVCRVDVNLLVEVLGQATGKRTLILIEGICLRETLRSANISPDLFVYVKRMSNNGLWNDGITTFDFHNAGATLSLAEPHLSDDRYHRFEHPHERADVVYHRIESEPLDCKDA